MTTLENPIIVESRHFYNGHLSSILFEQAVRGEKMCGVKILCNYGLLWPDRPDTFSLDSSGSKMMDLTSNLSELNAKKDDEVVAMKYTATIMAHDENFIAYGNMHVTFSIKNKF